MDKYRLRDKRVRNKELYDYWKNGHELTYDEVGAKFGVTGSRAFAIIKAMERKLDKAG